MKWIKHASALCAMTFPLAAVAVGTASGTVTHLFASAAYGDLIYVEVSGTKGGSPPACGTGKAPYQFVLPRSTALQDDIFNLLVTAKQKGKTISLIGLGSCAADNTVETLGAVTD